MIKIESLKQIEDKLHHDGDLREGDGLALFEMEAGDDLGFYQQACEWLRMQYIGNRAEIDWLRDRLQIDPGGSDKIDELEQSLQFREHAIRMELRGLLVELRDWTKTYGSALCPTGADTYGEGVRACKSEVRTIVGRWAGRVRA